MLRLACVLLVLCLLPVRGLAAPAPRGSDPGTSSTAKSQYVMAHYMPWFEADPAQGRWGWHWTMNHYHPEHMTGGRREAASHYAPLIGLYDSDDPDALACQVMLMKLSGMDGVIIDWYGTDDFLDYGLVHRNTLHLIKVVKQANLKFAMCYEDQTVPKLIAAHRLAETDAVAHGQRLMQWAQAHWFTDPAYLTLDGRPVVLVFGSGYYRGEQWEQIFAGLPTRPLLFTESDRRAPAVGGFAWPQPGGGTEAAFHDLDSFYARASGWPESLPAAFPRFDDIYQDAGVGKSWGHIDDHGGRTYADTLRRALGSQARVIQLVTWNDWGEGTQIEPSVEFGYRDLETTQRLRRQYTNARFAGTAADLRLPVRWYRLRKEYHDDRHLMARLDAASRALLTGRFAQARALLAEIPDTGHGGTR